MYSAAAVVLDINNQGVFARDARGRFLARQVLAIRSDDKLECFEVYPSSQRQMLELFREFDDCLRKRLDLDFAPIDGQEDEAKTELLIAGDWWHDDLWDLSCEPRTET